MGQPGLNVRLETFVSVLYGAALSYGFYAFVMSLKGGLDVLKPLLDGDWANSDRLVPHIQVGLLFWAVGYFLLCDYCGMARVNTLFPYRRRSPRFGLDCVIVVFYVMLFESCTNCSVLFPFEFTLLLFFCAAWGDRLRKEADLYVSATEGDLSVRLGIVARDVAHSWGAIIRNSHVVGGFLLLIITAVLLFSNYDEGQLSRHMTLWQESVVLVVLLGWHTLTVAYAIGASRSPDHLLVSGYLPKFIEKLVSKEDSK